MSESSGSASSYGMNVSLGDVQFGDGQNNFTFAPVQVGTQIETQIIQISADKVTQRDLIRTSPYKGLRRFNVADRDRFFGRDRLIRELYTAINESSFSLVLGASGSGKSSVIRAGVIPELRRSLGNEDLYDFIFTPNRDPFESLYRCLLNEEKDYNFSPSEAQIALDVETQTLATVIQTLRAPGDRWIIFIDQFEELFTTCDDPKLRQHFIEGLVEVAGLNDPNVRLILAMRADFLQNFSAYPSMGALASKNNIHLVTDMHPDELRQAIEQPAAGHGVVFEEGLVEQIIEEVKGQSGYLPLLQYTLNLLWETERRHTAADGHSGLDDRVLSRSSYNELEGVRGALQKRVDQLYEHANDHQQLAAKQIFLGLVQIIQTDGGDRAVSRRALRTEFSGSLVSVMLEQLINENLVVSSFDYSSKTDLVVGTRQHRQRFATVEIAHEILLSSWGRLRRWLEEEKETILLKSWLANETQQWLKARMLTQSSPEEELLTGSRLDNLVMLRDRQAFDKVGGLSEVENEYIDASLAWRQQRELAEQRRRQAEIRRARQLTLAMGLVGVLLAGVAVLSFRQRQAAIAQRQAANLREITALTAAAESELASQPELNELQALNTVFRAIQQLEALPQIDTVVQQEVFQSLHTVVYNIHEVNRMIGHTNLVRAIAVNHDGSLIATGSDDGTARIWDPNGVLITTLDHGSIPVLDVAFKPGGQRIATANQDGTVRIWSTVGQSVTLWQVDGIPRRVSYSPDSSLIATATDTGIVTLWSERGRPQQEWTAAPGLIHDLQFSPDGQRLATASADGWVRLWSLDGQLEAEFPSQIENQAFSVAFHPQANLLATGHGPIPYVRLWALDGTLLASFQGHRRQVSAVQFHPDGQHLVSTSDDRTAIVWQLFTPQATAAADPDPLPAATEAIGQLSQPRRRSDFLEHRQPDSPQRTLANGDSDPAAAIDLELYGNRQFVLGHPSEVSQIAFSPNGKWFATAGMASRMGHIWQLTDKALMTVRSPDHAQIVDVSLHSDGRLLATAAQTGQVHLWTERGQHLTSIQADTTTLRQIAFRPDHPELITLGANNVVRMWDMAGELLHEWTAPPGKLETMTISDDGNWLGMGLDSGTIHLIDLTEQRSPVTFEAHTQAVTAMQIRADLNSVVTASADGVAALWTLTGDRVSDVNLRTDLVQVDISADGEYIAAVSHDRHTLLWHQPTGEVQDVGGLEASAISFHPHQAQLAIGGWNGTVKLWDLTTRQWTAAFDRHEGKVESLEFDPAGDRLFVGATLTAKLWPIDTFESLIQAGCRWATSYFNNPNANVPPDVRQRCSAAIAPDSPADAAAPAEDRQS